MRNTHHSRIRKIIYFVCILTIINFLFRAKICRLNALIDGKFIVLMSFKAFFLTTDNAFLTLERLDLDLDV